MDNPAGKVLGAVAGAAGAGGALMLLGGNAKELSDLVEKAGVPFAVLLVMVWLLKPIADKHREFLDRTAQTHSDMAKSFEAMVSQRNQDSLVMREHTSLLTEICLEVKKQTKKMLPPPE